MARRTKETGRVTPKGAAKGGARPAGATTTSGRYTAPIPDELRSSPWWVPAMVVGFMAVGVLMIILNYISLLPASPTNWYLLGGLGGIIAGFIVATRWH
ncbi:MAG: cell division protein CrgA [Actinomycetota bacterium]|nr:cell division protein CrgA [Actinomycetota bacterium]